jgi:hypothetical protein
MVLESGTSRAWCQHLGGLLAVTEDITWGDRASVHLGLASSHKATNAIIAAHLMTSCNLSHLPKPPPNTTTVWPWSFQQVNWEDVFKPKCSLTSHAALPYPSIRHSGHSDHLLEPVAMGSRWSDPDIGSPGSQDLLLIKALLFLHFLNTYSKEFLTVKIICAQFRKCGGESKKGN